MWIWQVVAAKQWARALRSSYQFFMGCHVRAVEFAIDVGVTQRCVRVDTEGDRIREVLLFLAGEFLPETCGSGDGLLGVWGPATNVVRLAIPTQRTTQELVRQVHIDASRGGRILVFGRK